MTKLSNQARTLCMSPNSNQSIRPRKWMSKMKVWGYEFIFAMPDENPAQWWMNILEWVDLDPIFFGGWALPLISLSLYFYSVWVLDPFYNSPLFTFKGQQNWQDFQINKNGCCFKGYFSLVLFYSISFACARKKKQYWR